MRVNNQLDNRHIYSAGVSGSGKTYYIEQILKEASPSRLLIWDAKMEMSDGLLGCKKIYSLDKLYQELASNKQAKIIYVPTAKSDYKIFCELALAWANAGDGDTFVWIEEAGSVSGQGKSGDGEYDLITKGRAFGVVLCYVSQGFAGSSGTAFQNIDIFRVGRQKPSSLAYIGKNLSSKLAEQCKGLKGHKAMLFNQKTDEITPI